MYAIVHDRKKYALCFAPAIASTISGRRLVVAVQSNDAK